VGPPDLPLLAPSAFSPVRHILDEEGGRVHIVFKAVVAFVALGLLFLGFIFVIAGGSAENYGTGAAMLIVGLVLLGYIYRMSRIEASRPKVIQQDVHVTMGGSGEFQERRMNCPSCGAPVEEKDVTLMSGGLVIKCPYCETTSALEEEPKW